jgi:putative transposase
MPVWVFDAMTYYHRNLPHWQPEGAAVFLTWRLHGTLAQFRVTSNADASRAFVAYDRALHGDPGPKWLGEPQVADCVVEALKLGKRQLKLYERIAYCVMPNHVHVVAGPQAELPKITKSIRGFTAREANKILGRTGEAFWQDESYDHWVRSRDELNYVIGYTERNPLVSGLAQRIEEYRWSSAFGS